MKFFFLGYDIDNNSMNKRNNSKDSLDNLLQQTFQKVIKEKESLIMERDEINIKLKKIDAFLKAATKNLNGNIFDKMDNEEEDDDHVSISTPSTTVRRYAQVKGIEELGKAKGGEIFLWGLQEVGNEATASEVAEAVAKLKIDSVKSRIDGEDLSRLKQWLTVSADYLVKTKVLVKVSRTDRKGGIAYRLK